LHVLPTQETIDELAGRIEEAFHRRCASWNRGCSTPRVWAAAAANLWRAHQEIPEAPIDPELFVAAQPIHQTYSDPWTDLTQPEAVERYAHQIRRIIGLLQTELARELARAERLISKGTKLSRIVLARKSRLSALGSYIVALRAGRSDLAALLHDRALEQHRSCPLYRIACYAFLPEDCYPGDTPKSRRGSPIFAAGAGVHDSRAN
jgi:hypothetical protein